MHEVQQLLQREIEFVKLLRQLSAATVPESDSIGHQYVNFTKIYIRNVYTHDIFAANDSTSNDGQVFLCITLVSE